MYREPSMGEVWMGGGVLIGRWKWRGEVERMRPTRGKDCGIRTGEEPDCDECEEGDLAVVSSSAFSAMVSEMFSDPRRVSM